MAGNTITNNNVDYTSTSSTLGGGTALKFNGTNAHLNIPNVNKSLNGDYTFSIVVLQQTVISDSRLMYFCSLNMPDDYNQYIKQTDPRLWISATNVNDVKKVYGVGCELFNTNNASYGYDVNSFGSNVHIALTRKNGIERLFIDGVLVTTSNNSFTRNIPVINIGCDKYTGINHKYANFTIDDVCLIDGKALWTSNFTPPTSYLPNKLPN